MNASVVVTCYNEEKNIGDCLESLIHQDYALGKYEIIVSDGSSTDKTQPIVKEYAGRYSNLKLIIEEKKGAAAGRNKGVKSAIYDYVAFIDADCLAPPGWLSLLADNFQRIKIGRDDIAAVGGRNIPAEGADIFTQAIGIALDSYLGSFNSAQGRLFKKSAFVLSLSTANSLYEKRKISRIGYFDESLKSEAEDADLNHRLYASGNKFFFIPASFVWHKMRSSPALWIKNMFRYGKGRARLLKRYPDMRTTAFSLPILFITSMLLVPFGIFSKIFFLPLLYFIFILIFSFFQCLRKDALHLALITTGIYIIQHFAYAAGEVYGLINCKVK